MCKRSSQLGSLTFGVPSLEYPSWLYAVLPWLHMVEVQGKEGLKCREGGTRVGSAVYDFVGETSSTLATLSSAASLKLPFSCLQSAPTPDLYVSLIKTLGPRVNLLELNFGLSLGPYKESGRCFVSPPIPCPWRKFQNPQHPCAYCADTLHPVGRFV